MSRTVGEPMMDVHRGFKNIGRAIYASKGQRSPEQIRKIKEILDPVRMTEAVRPLDVAQKREEVKAK